ncbi:MAG: hypothetical protein EOO45_05935 [Flavobacterium sp.]|nr:MAG: hypothetical protein EOO45_05935 [Flavobacterium sp.]
MLNKLVYILFLLSAFQMNAQTPILSLYDNDLGDVHGAYYKDINNKLDEFIGTWIYSKGNTSLTITLQKKLMQHTVSGNLDFYEDIIIGEYKYIENGVTKVNTLSQLQLNLEPDAHSIVGNSMIGTTERRLYTQFAEPGREIPGMDESMIFRRLDDGAIQKLRLVFRMTEGYHTVNGQQPQFTSYSIPFGEYLLVKQP